MKQLFRNFFKNKNVLITGHTGFIGSWLGIWLNELNANVVGYALPPITKEDNFVVTNFKKKIVSIIGNVKNYKKLNKVFKTYKPEIVFHLAAQPIVRMSYIIPKETYDTNIGGTVNVFENFRKNESSKIMINFTTDKCYENLENIEGYKETDRLGGHDPYSSSKACSEFITSAYRQSYFTNKALKNEKYVSSIRSGNVIGGGDWQEDRLVPDCMKAIRNSETIKIRNPKSVRPWQFVLEPIRGILLLTVKMSEGQEKYSSAWNFGPDKNAIFSVKEIVDKIINYIGKGSYEFSLKKENDKFHESKVLLLDNSKAYENLGWKPLLTLEEAIKMTCDWYLEEKIGYDFDVNQINDYLKKVI